MHTAIRITNVTKRFGLLQALDGISLDIAKGEFFGLLGPNGAGKTTLINTLCGLTRPDSGAITVMGHDVTRDYRIARRSLGVVPQELVFDPFFTVRETLRLQSGYFGLSRNDDWIDEVMMNLDLNGKADSNMRALSGGMKRRVLVAQALVHKPPVIVLDEPTAGVDVELRQGLWSFVRRLNTQGHTILLTTHYLEEAESLCSRIAMLKNGKVVALDKTENLLSHISGMFLKLKLSPDQLPQGVIGKLHKSDKGSHILKIRDYAEVETILGQLRSADIFIEEMALLKPDLEDVFMQIMRSDTVAHPDQVVA